jgi:hypothetical protein
MSDIANQLKKIVESADKQLRTIHESQTQLSQIESGWSAKQILGHLIDSAANNHQRFVRAQFMPDLVFPGYDQELWITAQHYNDEAWLTLVELWKLYNFHLAHIIENIPAAILERPRSPHNLDKIAWKTVSADEPVTLEYLINDYIGHLQDHLAQLYAVV